LTRQRPVAIALVVAALGSCGWIEAAMRPFSVATSVFTFSVAAAVLATGALAARRKTQVGPTDIELSRQVTETSLRMRGVVAWTLATGLVVAVELWELFHSPRAHYPTLSSLANEVIGPGHRVERTAAFVCWGAVGLVLASRPRQGS